VHDIFLVKVTRRLLAARLIILPAPDTIRVCRGAFSFSTVVLDPLSREGFEGVVAIVHSAGHRLFASLLQYARRPLHPHAFETLVQWRGDREVFFARVAADAVGNDRPC